MFVLSEMGAAAGCEQMSDVICPASEQAHSVGG